MNRRILLLGLALIVPLLVVLFVGLGTNPNAIRSPLIGQTAPLFALVDISSGERISLADLEGKPAVVNFWATWCVPCYAEHPVLVDAAERLRGEVVFVGVIYEDEDDKVRRFLARYGSAYPSLRDVDGKTAIAYGVYGVPETFFIDREGQIVAKHEGALDYPKLSAYLAQMGARL